MLKRIIIFASGSGTNAENIMHHFRHSNVAQVVAVMTDNAHAGVITRAVKYDVPVLVFDKKALDNPYALLKDCIALRPDLIVLAGFLKLIPPHFIRAFPFKIINIHPSLLPKYGGKGMYGLHVHQAVIDSGDTISGITIHFVNEHYDDGKYIMQQRVNVGPDDNAESLAQKIHKLEYQYLPLAIESVLQLQNE